MKNFIRFLKSEPWYIWLPFLSCFALFITSVVQVMGVFLKGNSLALTMHLSLFSNLMILLLIGFPMVFISRSGLPAWVYYLSGYVLGIAAASVHDLWRKKNAKYL